MNSTTAAELLSEDAVLASRSHIKEVLLADARTISFPVVSDGLQPLKVTICWSDPPGPAPQTITAVDPSDLMLVNDLDLRITDPNTIEHKPWVLDPAQPTNAATTGDNIRDNVEQVLVSAPAAGTHTVTVTHKGNLLDSEQNVSIVISGNTPQPAPKAEIDELLRISQFEVGYFWDTVVGGIYQVESSPDLVNWSNEGGQIGPLTISTSKSFDATSPGAPPEKFFRVVRLW
jgi:hypothetical protein